MLKAMDALNNQEMCFSSTSCKSCGFLCLFFAQLLNPVNPEKTSGIMQAREEN